jgi:type VI secretion system protein ImpC
MADAKSAPPGRRRHDRGGAGLLDQIISTTKQIEPDRAQELVKTSSSRRWPAPSPSIATHADIDKAAKAIDKMPAQLNAIMHDPKFSAEGSWQGCTTW